MFRNSTDSRSLFHDHPRNHGLSLFRMALARLRPALYYFTAVVIIIFFYCLLFYEPESGRHHPHRRFRGHYGQASALISVSGINGETEDDTTGTDHFSAAYLLEEFIRKANLHFADNYARKTSLVPTLLGSDELNSSPLLTRPGNSQHHQRSLLENFHYETVSQQKPNTSANHSQITAGENGVSIHLLGEGDGDQLAEEDEEYLALVDEPDTIEHYLETLGFNIRHITRYLLHVNQSLNNATSQVTKNPKFNVVAKSVTKHSPTSSPHFSAQNNFSDVLELLNGIPTAENSNNTLVFVSAINTNQYSTAYRFIKSFEAYRKKNANDLKMHLRLMIYDLGLTEDQLFEVLFIIY